jgi:multiple sugar transport system permease protein
MVASVNQRREARAAWCFLAPFLLLVLVFQLYVLASGVRMSLTNEEGIWDGEFIGLRNFADLLFADDFQSRQMWRALGTSLLYTGGCMATQVPLAFLLATALNHVPFVRLRAALRAAFLIPVVVNSVTVAFLFAMYFQQGGLVNHVLGSFGLPSDKDWLSDSSLAVPIMVLVNLWRSIGLQTIVFLAQLQTVDPSVLEAARLDGASSWTVLRHITLPLLRPAVTFAAVTTGIFALQMFDLSYVLFPVRYGPGGAGKTIVAYVYDLAFSSGFATGKAAAAGWLAFLVVMGVSLVQFRVLGLGRQEGEP